MAFLDLFGPVTRTAFAADLSTSPAVAVASEPVDSTRPSASLYRAQAVAIDVALSIPAVRKAQHVIVGTPSTFTLSAWQGDTRLAADDPRSSWLRQPDPNRTLQWLLSRTLSDGLWHDRAVWKIDKNIARQTRTATRLHPNRVDVVQDPHDPDLVDTWIIDGRSYSPAEARAAGYLTFDFGGLGGLKRYGASLLGVYADLQAAAGNYARAPHPKAILKNSGPDLTDDEIDALLESWEAARNTSSVGYLNETMAYEPHGWNPEEMQLVQAREHAALEVARLFGLPAKALDAKSGDSMTYGNVVQWRRDLLESLRPWMTVITQTLSLDDRAATPTGLALPYGIRAEFDVDAYTRDDPQVRMATWQTALDSGALTVDEVRAAEPLARGELPAADEAEAKRESVARVVQQVYLGVGTVITADEARALINQAGGDLPIPAPPELQPQEAPRAD